MDTDFDVMRKALQLVGVPVDVSSSACGKEITIFINEPDSPEPLIEPFQAAAILYFTVEGKFQAVG